MSHLLEPKKILVIRFNAVGDVVLSSVLCNSLKTSFPNAKVDFLTYQPSDELFSSSPSINQVIGLSSEVRKSPIKYLSFARHVASNNYDIIIDASSTAKSELISFFARKCRFKIGRHKPRRGFSYTHRIKTSSSDRNKVLQRLEMLGPLAEHGYPIVQIDELSLHVNDQEKLAKKQEMTKLGVRFDAPRFLFAISSKDAQKKWNRNYMRQTIDHCRKKYGAQIILFGGLPHEIDDIKRIHKELGCPEDVFTEIAVNSIRDLPVLFSLCDVFIGNEGGPRHIAQAVGLPTATVFSPHAKKSEWLPLDKSKHQAIEWRDVSKVADILDVNYEYGDTLYFKLYNSMKPSDFIPIVDQVVQSHVLVAGK